MNGSILKKIIMGIAGIFAVSLYAPGAFSQETQQAPCLESCLNTSSEFFTCCSDRENSHSCGVEEYCRDQCACGNKEIETVCGVTEQCDDGNNAPGDGCDQVCQNECGNGVVDRNEQCDDGNRDAGDGCDQFCRTENLIFNPPPVVSITYKGQQFFDYDSLFKLVSDDFKIKPDSPTEVVIKGIRFDGTGELRASVMGKVAVANEAARIAQAFANGVLPTGTTTEVYSYSPICSNSKSVLFFGTPGKGCRETSINVWGSAAQACSASQGCCIELDDAGAPKSPTDPTLNRNYTCRVPPAAPSVNTVQGDGIY